MHGYLPGRRREGAMAVQQIVQSSVSKLGLSSMAHLRDMTNAFACTKDVVRRESLHDLVPGAEPDYPQHRQYFEQKLSASVVTFETDCGELVDVVPEEGNIVGSTEGPLMFAWSYWKKSRNGSGVARLLLTHLPSHLFTPGVQSLMARLCSLLMTA